MDKKDKIVKLINKIDSGRINADQTARILDAYSLLINHEITNGLKSSSAICFGKPHSLSLSSGPTTITERPE